MHELLPRSYLFVPGNRPERFDKACAAGADAVIIDLEDAVPAAQKAAARNAVAAWLAPAKPVLLRINSTDSEWFGDDLELCKQPGVAGIVLPKAEFPEQLQQLATACPALALLPLIETAQGFYNALPLARCLGVQRLLFGSIDFQLDLGIEGDDDALLYFRSQLVGLSRLAGIQAPVDGVTTALDDPAQLQSDTQRARLLGFGAKLCIHPAQIAAVNLHFSPSREEQAWAERVLAAAEAAQGAAVALDGKMIDRPVILRAQKITVQASRIADSQSRKAETMNRP
jgi:citrate lyase subunit beta/citryl-CoA lyase